MSFSILWGCISSPRQSTVWVLLTGQGRLNTFYNFRDVKWEGGSVAVSIFVIFQ